MTFSVESNSEIENLLRRESGVSPGIQEDFTTVIGWGLSLSASSAFSDQKEAA